MTNEEAIKALKRIRDEAINNFVGDWQDYEAFDIALKALADRKTEPTVSKMEQVDEPQTCSFSDCDNFKNPDYARCIECKRKQIEPKDEPQTDCAWKGEDL